MLGNSLLQTNYLSTKLKIFSIFFRKSSLWDLLKRLQPSTLQWKNVLYIIRSCISFLHVPFPVKLNFSISLHISTGLWNFDIRVIHYFRRDGHCQLITLTMPILNENPENIFKSITRENSMKNYPKIRTWFSRTIIYLARYFRFLDLPDETRPRHTNHFPNLLSINVLGEIFNKDIL